MLVHGFNYLSVVWIQICIWIQTLFDLDLERKGNRKREIENKPTTKVNPAPAQPFPRGPVRPALPSLAAQPARHLLSPRDALARPKRAAQHTRVPRPAHPRSACSISLTAPQAHPPAPQAWERGEGKLGPRGIWVWVWVLGFGFSFSSYF